MGDLILLGVLQGARGESHARRIERALRAYPVAQMLNADLAICATRSYRTLRARDFEPMSEYLGLKIFRF
jgi:hypothetical protein